MFKYIFILVTHFSFSYASDISSPLYHEQQRQIYEKLQNVDTTIPLLEKMRPESNITDDKNNTVCFVTHAITVKNITLLSKVDQKEAIEPYIGRCNGIRSLTSFADSLTKRYMDKGYITSRVYLIPQDISDGSIEFYALEGKIAHVISDSTKTSGAFTGLEGEALHLGDLESSIEQVNRLRSNKTTMNLLPANEEGSTDVILNSKETLPFFGSLGMNNYGSDATGKLQLYGGFVWENFFGFSDILSINLNTTDKQQLGRKSFGNSYTYSVPLGKWLWEASLSRFTYSQTILGLNDSYISHGESEVYSLSSAYKLFHTQTQNVELSASMAQKKTLSTLEGAVVESSTYNLSVGKLGLKYVYRQPSWEIYALIDYHHGLNPFHPTTGRTLKHDFSKWTLAVGGTKQIDSSLPITYQFSGYAQHSNDLLYSVEQISIGGAYSVRGFQKQNISGKNGWYARNDLLFQMTPNLSPYIAYDIGHIGSDIDTAGGTLTSTSFGLRGRFHTLFMDIYHAIPLSSPNHTVDSNPFIGISVSSNF